MINIIPAVPAEVVQPVQGSQPDDGGQAFGGILNNLKTCAAAGAEAAQAEASGQTSGATVVTGLAAQMLEGQQAGEPEKGSGADILTEEEAAALMAAGVMGQQVQIPQAQQVNIAAAAGGVLNVGSESAAVNTATHKEGNAGTDAAAITEAVMLAGPAAQAVSVASEGEAVKQAAEGLQTNSDASAVKEPAGTMLQEALAASQRAGTTVGTVSAKAAGDKVEEVAPVAGAKEAKDGKTGESGAAKTASPSVPAMPAEVDAKGSQTGKDGDGRQGAPQPDVQAVQPLADIQAVQSKADVQAVQSKVVDNGLGQPAPAEKPGPQQKGGMLVEEAARPGRPGQISIEQDARQAAVEAQLPAAGANASTGNAGRALGAVQRNVAIRQQRVFEGRNISISPNTQSAQAALQQQAGQAAQVFGAEKARHEVLGRSLVDQVATGMNAMFKQGDDGMTIKLYPPSLGSVKVQLFAKEQEVRATIVAESAAVRDILLENRALLKSSLEDAGLNLKEFTVQLESGSGGGQRGFSGDARDGGQFVRQGSFIGVEEKNTVKPAVRVADGSTIHLVV
jgi:flagellar hook-length control protein FliK